MLIKSELDRFSQHLLCALRFVFFRKEKEMCCYSGLYWFLNVLFGKSRRRMKACEIAPVLFDRLVLHFNLHPPTRANFPPCHLFSHLTSHSSSFLTFSFTLFFFSFCNLASHVTSSPPLCHGLCARLGVWERAPVLWFPRFVVTKCDGSRSKVSDMIPLKCKNVFLKNQIMIMCREYPMSPFCFPKGCLFYTHKHNHYV